MTITRTENDLPVSIEEWQTWTPEAKEKFFAALQATAHPKHIWYCKRGRKCDGKPHEGAPEKHARGDQWPPVDQDWVYWVLKGGRGSGKTRSGSEWTRYMSQTIKFGSIIGPHFGHIRDFMVEGPSGLLVAFDRAGIPALWEPSKKKITLQREHVIHAFTGEEPARLRGPEHGYVWLDEPAHIPLIEDVWKMMKLGLRYGSRPLVLATTTPLPTKWMRELLEHPKTRAATVSTYANIDNLADTFAEDILSDYEGTRLGRQELYGEVLEDVEGALWHLDEMIAPYRILEGLTYEDMDRIIVSIDPAGTELRTRDQTGIVVVGQKGTHFYVLADFSGHYSPNGWAKKAWKAYDDFEADMVVAEKNYGGEMVRSTLRNERDYGRIKLVNSRRGKQLRAEPVVSLYEQQRVHHFGILKDLEGQMTTWVPGEGSSPDRVDALVHGLTELSGKSTGSSMAIPGEAPMTTRRDERDLDALASDGPLTPMEVLTSGYGMWFPGDPLPATKGLTPWLQ